MRRLAPALLAAALALLCAAPAASAEFGFQRLEIASLNSAGEPDLRAGAHPFALRTTIDPNTVELAGLGRAPDGQPRELAVSLPEGLAGSPFAVERCSNADFTTAENHLGGAINIPACPDSTVVGLVGARGTAGDVATELKTPLYNLSPPPGTAARIGFRVTLVGTVVVDLSLKESPPYNLIATSANITQMQRFYGVDVTVWSDPGSPAHDDDRGLCGATLEAEGEEEEGADAGDVLGIDCPVEIPARPFITLPRACPGTPFAARFEALSWAGERAAGEATARGPGGEPLSVAGCERLGFEPRIANEASSRAASSPSGLEFELSLADEGLTGGARTESPGCAEEDPETACLTELRGIANSDLAAAEVTLPEGMTVNPSQAEGLVGCSEARFARETARSEFGSGCPAAAKIGEVEVKTPLLEGVLLRGSLFLASPRENPFGSLIALYMTIKEPKLGIGVRIAGEVSPDPATGQLVSSFEDLPQVPFSEFRLRFRAGGRAALITPPVCGEHETTARLTPSGAPGAPVTARASFAIDRGPGGGPCPPGGTPPFAPGFGAGTASNHAGSFSPVAMRLTRADGEQDLTRFSATLPPGLVARLAGTARCPEAQIAAAGQRSGREELASPSCPAASRIGGVVAGAGAGSALTYVPGSIYLAPPYNGAPLSVVAVVPAVAGPFDVGTVITRQALGLDPITGEVGVDGDRSDPIPHILAGIPLAVRDIRVSVDRPAFTLNPTSCREMATVASIWGGGADVFSALDDLPVARSARFQAAGCRGLGFKPRLAIRLKGGVRRGAHPALRAHVRPRAGDANFRRAVVKLPTSAFLEQAHIRTVCTRVQFAAPPGHGARCPKGSRYGYARAWSPLLDEPAQGPVYLRSSDNKLPDLVAALTGPPSAAVAVELSARIDSVRGGIRSTFARIPDFPVSRFILDMQGGKKGLIVNSRHLCHKPARNRARANLRGQNGRVSRSRPRVVAVGCRERRAARRGGR